MEFTANTIDDPEVPMSDRVSIEVGPSFTIVERCSAQWKVNERHEPEGHELVHGIGECNGLRLDPVLCDHFSLKEIGANKNVNDLQLIYFHLKIKFDKKSAQRIQGRYVVLLATNDFKRIKRQHTNDFGALYQGSNVIDALKLAGVGPSFFVVARIKRFDMGGTTFQGKGSDNIALLDQFNKGEGRT